MAVDALRGLRQDLFHDAFAYRPLPRMSTDGPLSGGCPRACGSTRPGRPHALIGVAALFTLMLAAGRLQRPGPAARSAVPCSRCWLTMVRPVGAFWLSMAATPFAGSARQRLGATGRGCPAASPAI